MKSRFLNYLTVGLVCVGVGTPLRLAAQEDREHRHHKYKLIDLGTFGGPSSLFSDGNPPLSKILNNLGAAVGTADTATPDPYAPNCFTDCFVAQGFRFEDGVLTGLGALSGINSSFPLAVNERGLIGGISENGTVDPLTGFPNIDAVLWTHKKIINLGTFGGSQSIALGLNNQNQVVGTALNTTPDSFAPAFDPGAGLFPGTTEARAFRWDAGVMRDLGTLGGPDSSASYINERGQVAGQSFTNSFPNKATGLPTQDPFLWTPCDRDRWADDGCDDEHERRATSSGKMLDLGTLGGTSGLVAGLNNRGQVIGQSNLAGDLTHHPFLWERGRMRDLGTLGGDFGYATWLNEDGEVVGVASLPIPCPGCGEGPQIYHAFFWSRGVIKDLGTLDKCSLGNGLNAKSQIVGSSGVCGVAKHAFLSEAGGPLIDLNTLVRPGSDLRLTEAIYINDYGEIAGKGITPSGTTHAYLLTPCDGDHPGIEGCDYDQADLDAPAEADVANSLISKPENQPPTQVSFGHTMRK